MKKNKNKTKEELPLILIKQRLFAIEEKHEGMIEEKMKFLIFPKYRVADTILSYRQINILGTSGLLNEEKENSRGWRKFTFKDLVYLDILSELRKYGLENKQLKGVKDFFYKKNSDVNLILIAILFGIKVTIALEVNGNLRVFETITGSLSMEKDYRAVIQLNLNEFVNMALERLKIEKVNYKSTLEIISKHYTKKQ
ncbi:MAG: MerR family transcriptional regulator [Endomicrobiia bacterium]